jgi:hypothetical protein
MTAALLPLGNGIGWVGPCKGQNPHQGRLRHSQLLHAGPLGHLGPPELNGSPPGPSIKVFVNRRHCEKALAQNTKTTFFKYHFLTVKHRQNTVKHRLLVEKESGNECRKNQDKNEPFFLRIFLEVSVFTPLTVY